MRRILNYSSFHQITTQTIKGPQEGAQIDLLFDRPDGVITLCEIKCSEGPFAIDKSYAHDLLKKMEIFRKQTRTKKQLFLSMITIMGLKPTIYSEEIVASHALLKICLEIFELVQEYCTT